MVELKQLDLFALDISEDHIEPYVRFTFFIIRFQKLTIKYNLNSLDGCQTGSGWKRKQELEERCKHSTVDFKGTVGIKYLRNGKHFPSFYHVIEK